MTHEEKFKGIAPTVSAATTARQNIWGFLTQREREALHIASQRHPEVLRAMSDYKAGHTTKDKIRMLIAELFRRRLV